MDVAGGKFYDNLFHEAVAEQDIRLVRLMLEHGADVNAPQGAFSPMTPLHLAANIGDVEKCKLLLEFKADVNAHTPDGATPLDFAAVWDHRAICELLLAHGAQLGMQAACALGRTEDIARILNADPQSVNQRDNRLRRTPLHWAAASGHRGLVAVLIRAGADVNAKAPRYGQAGNVVTGPETWGADEAKDAGETPLHVAARAGHAPVVELLVQNGADVNASDENQMTVLQHAVYAGQVAVVQLLLEHGAKVDVGDDSCLPAAFDNVAITKLLLARNPGQAALNQALSNAASADPQVAALLLAAGAQADIFAATSLGLNDRIAELLDTDPKLVNSEHTEYPYGRPLPLAAKNGHVEAVKLLLARQADVEPEDATVPLQAAAAGDYLEIMDLLAEHGADVNHKDGMGGSALQAAAEAGHLRAVKWLMEHGADPLIRDVYQATPLHAAARSGAVAVVRILVEAGVPVDSRDDFRETPLHEAADDGQTETAELLLQLGADVNARNRRGQTPLFYAERERHPRFEFLDHIDRRPVAAMLRSSGGIK
jgi:cytohesin